CGTPSPRDSDQQRDELGTPVDFADRRGGDLIFFPGHVGILVDADTLFHANAYWMTTVEEPLDDVIARMDADGSGGGVTGVRRI
ncbi:MAG: C40 family peptidase, partial [Sandarakinorhabdus sp.]|nr:C40 family peptidase [Sandarakinorhabdus sp.]